MFLTTVLKAFCESCDCSFFGSAIRNSVWLFPFVEIFHLFALGVLGGTILALNLRALGLRFQSNSLSALSRELQPWMLGSLTAMLVSGFLLFSSEAVKMYYNPAFRIKMAFLIIALVFTFTFHRKVTVSGVSSRSSLRQKLVAVLSLILWSGVGLSGRAIGYVRQVHSSESRGFEDISLAQSEPENSLPYGSQFCSPTWNFCKPSVSALSSIVGLGHAEESGAQWTRKCAAQRRCPQ